VQTNDWQAHNTAAFFLYPLLSYLQVITTIWIWAGCTWDAGLKRKEAKVPYKEMNEWFCCDKKENCSLPPLVLSLSTERRRPDKLAIRGAIWQALLSAFAVPLNLLNIMEPCSLALVHIRKIHSLEKTTDDSSVSSLCSALVSMALWSVSHQLFRVCRLSPNSSYDLFNQEIASVNLFFSLFFFFITQILRWRLCSHICY